jgi:hypothetical protein
VKTATKRYPEAVQKWHEVQRYVRDMADKRSKKYRVSYSMGFGVSESPVEFNPAIGSEHIIVTVYGSNKPQLGCAARVSERLDSLKKMLWDADIPWVNLHHDNRGKNYATANIVIVAPDAVRAHYRKAQAKLAAKNGRF